MVLLKLLLDFNKNVWPAAEIQAATFDALVLQANKVPEFVNTQALAVPVLDQEIVELHWVDPEGILQICGEAEIEPDGGGGRTGSVTDLLALPPGPVQVTVTVQSLVIVIGYDLEPLIAVVLLAGMPLQLVALVDDHVNVELPPVTTGFGLNEAFTVGACAPFT